MKTITKTMKRNIMTIVMAAVFTLPAVAQVFGPQKQSSVAPIARFYSTSTMAGSGSGYASKPSLNDDGIANAPYSASSSGPRKAPPLIVTPEVLQTGLVPLGDAILPLMMMALAFCGVVYLRRKKRTLNG